MAKLSTLKVIERPQKVIVYGPPKSGKTEFVGKLSEDGFLLDWLDLENGSSTLVNRISQTGKENINLISVQDIRDAPRASETVSQLASNFFKPITMKLCDNHGRIQCPACLKDKEAEWSEIDLKALQEDRSRVLVIDSWTQFVQSLIDYHNNKGNLLNKGSLLESYKKFDWDDWGWLGNILAGVLGAIQNAPFHIVVISHESEVEMVDGSDKLVPTGGSSKFSRSVAKYFDHVLYTTVENRKHSVLSSSVTSSKILMGTRSGLDTSSGSVSLADILRGATESTQPKQGVNLLKDAQSNAMSGLSKLGGK